MFRFRFQALLELANAHRDNQQAALGDVLARWNQVDEHRRQIARQRRDLVARDHTQRVGVLRLSRLLVQERFEQQLQDEEQRLAAVAAELQTEVDRCRDALQQATQEVRKLELLRDQDHRAWTLRQAKAEQLQLDERAARAVAAFVKT